MSNVGWSNTDIQKLALVYSKKERNLDQIVQSYKNLSPVSSSSYGFNVPRLIIDVFDRLIQLKEEKLCKTNEILNAFLNCDHDGAKWNQLDDDRLEEYKLQINQRKKPFKEIKEPRFLTQLLVDFLNCLAQPVINNTFRQEWKHVLADQAEKREFVLCQNPKMANLNENLYHTLDFMAKSLNALLAKSQKASKLHTLRLVLLRLTLALTQADFPHFFIHRQALVHKDFLDLAATDSITDLLYMWVTEYTPAARERFRGICSPMPNLHKRLVEVHGTQNPHDPDKFASKGLSDSFIKHQQQHRRRLQQADSPHAPVISEEDDGTASQASERNLDALPEAIRAFIPVFMDMPYEEQNSIIKELNGILQQSSLAQMPEASRGHALK